MRRRADATNRLLRWALLAAGLTLCAGCADDPPTGLPAAPAPVMALDLGNTWHYEQRANEPGAPLVALDRTIVAHLEIAVPGGTVTVAHEQVVTGKGARALPGASRLLRNEDDGLYCYGFVDGDGVARVQGRVLVAPRGADPGDRFPLEPGVFLVCVAADSLVTTRFGDVVADVFHYSLDEGTVLVPDVYVVPGVGPTRYYSREATETLVGHTFVER
jgi:hypothetical protein